MSFFIRENSKPVNGIKRKFSGKKPTKKFKKNEEISSESESEHSVNDNGIDDATSDEDENITAQEKRLKLAKIYLEEIKRQEEERSDRKEFNELNISQRLKEDLLEQKGRLHRNIADRIVGVDTERIHRWRTKNRDGVTVVIISRDNDTIYSGTKSGVIYKYSLKTKQKLQTLTPDKTVKTSTKNLTINSLSITHDNKYLAVAQGNNIIIRDGTTLKELHIFKGHTNIVTGVTFRRDTYQLFSCSKDRSVKVWSCDEMVYVESLFGHQNEITAIDSLQRERAITSGGFDSTIRVWKIAEDSQLIYNGPPSSIDCVKLLNEDHFVSGANDGSIHVWSSMKKKPLVVVQEAHGLDKTNNLPNWIVSVTPLLNSDLIASGSYDGVIRLWKVSNGYRQMDQILEIPLEGFINSICFSQNGDHLIAAVSREHRFGRWWDLHQAINSIVLIPLLKKE